MAIHQAAASGFSFVIVLTDVWGCMTHGRGMLSVALLHHVDISLKDNEHKPVVAEAVTQHDLIAHHMSDHVSDLVKVHVENK